MSRPEDTLADSPADFDSSLAYALHSEMRRLIILVVVGSVLFPAGLALFFGPAFGGTVEQLLRRAVGLLVALVGATFLYGGLVATVFKLVADANILAAEQ